MGLPPPAQWTLIDAGRVVGRTTDSTRSIPIDAADALTIRRDGEREAIFAGRRAIASLVRPRAHDSAADAPASESFAFEIELPQPADELRARAMAHLMYRALRKSGLRWTLWRSGADTVSTAPSAAAQHSRLVTLAANDTDQTTRA
jgi:hypothetical protein